MINRVQQHGVAVIQNRGSCGHGFRFLKEVLVSCEHTRHRLGGASAVRGFTARSCESPFAGLISFGPGVPEPEEDPARSVAQTVPKPACDVTRGGGQVMWAGSDEREARDSAAGAERRAASDRSNGKVDSPKGTRGSMKRA